MIYKICTREAWATALSDGQLTGSGDDLRDGYIHLSTARQLAGTLSKHFRGQADLVILAIREESVSQALKWEPSRGGDLFPHLYGQLEIKAVAGIHPLSLGPNGEHVLPEGLS